MSLILYLRQMLADYRTKTGLMFFLAMYTYLLHASICLVFLFLLSFYNVLRGTLFGIFVHTALKIY